MGCYTAWLGSGRSFLTVPVSDGEVYCFASALGGGAVGGDNGWLVETFADFPTPVRSFSPTCGRAERRCTTRRSRKCGSRAGTGGASLAVEDAVALAELLPHSGIMPAYQYIPASSLGDEFDSFVVRDYLD